MHIEYWIHTTVRIMAGSKLKADMVEALWLFLKCLDIEQLQIAHASRTYGTIFQQVQ